MRSSASMTSGGSDGAGAWNGECAAGAASGNSPDYRQNPYFLNFCAPGMALGYAVGRIGCFLVGDDYGIPSSLPWAISFPNGLPPTIDRVHPTQLYEVIFMTVVFLILWKIRKLDKPNGWMYSIYLIFAASERFLIEFVRSTTPSHIPSLSLAQVTAIIIIAIGVGKLVLIQKSEQNLANQNK